MDSRPNGSGNQAPGRRGAARALASVREAVWEPAIRFFSRPSGARRAVLVAGLYVIMFVLMTASPAPDSVDWQVGDVATRDVAAPRDVVNRFRTQQLREQAAREAVREAELDPVNWEINPAEALRAEERVKAAFEVVRAAQSPAESAAPGPEDAGLTDAAQAGEADADASGPKAGVAGLDSAPTAPSEELLAEVESELASRDVTLSREWIVSALQSDGAVLSALERQALALVTEIMGQRRIGAEDVEQEREAVSEHPSIADRPADERRLVAEVVQAAIRPNLIPSPERMERARQEAIRSVEEVTIRQGQIIIRRGDPVEPEHIMILQDLGLLDGRRNYRALAGVGILLLLLFAGTGVYLYQHRRDIAASERQLALLGLIALTVTGLAKVGSVLDWPGTGFLVPVGLAGLLVTLLLDSRLALVVVVTLAAAVAALYGLDGRYFVVALAGGMAGVYSVSRVSQRSDLTRAGLVVGGAGFLAMVSLGLLADDLFLIQFSFLALLNGIVSAVGTIGLLPYLETLFGITSSIRLLELSNPNHPLLRKLLMEAPGTYHHSILVGNLAEAAAEAIGADQLLVRVGAQYHDIGKTKRPYFFVENQFGGENPHDKISPTLSTLIVVSHVRDGVELAREYQLPQVIVDFIREHHGTDLVKYFYSRAVENARGEPVDERDFRYPGPRPQSKETAIVMLADAVEAAVRSLGRPTPGRIEGLVRRIIKERLEAGELDESDLTLRDLDKIAEAFVRVLMGIYHKRVEYPEIGKEPEANKPREPETRRA
ncbi:MAG: HDIG domain-containing protein [Firmicutes bacterium]|nr:HDIG domain-containing protein [Bacillota bacterium]